MLDIKQFELKRLNALLDKAGLIGENEQSALEVYEEALSISQKGYKLVLKRDIDEVFVNNYNIEWIINWDANIDL